MFKVKNINSNAPFYATDDAAGFDIFTTETALLDPGEYRLFKTGLFCDVEYNKQYSTLSETGYDGELMTLKAQLEIRPRSGLAFKNGITVLNAPGTIDALYPNEIGVLLINHGKVPYIVNADKPIAQGVVTVTVRARGVDQKGTARVGGFGSTNEAKV